MYVNPLDFSSSGFCFAPFVLLRSLRLLCALSLWLALLASLFRLLRVASSRFAYLHASPLHSLSPHFVSYRIASYNLSRSALSRLSCSVCLQRFRKKMQENCVCTHVCTQKPRQTYVQPQLRSGNKKKKGSIQSDSCKTVRTTANLLQTSPDSLQRSTSSPYQPCLLMRGNAQIRMKERRQNKSIGRRRASAEEERSS